MKENLVKKAMNYFLNKAFGHKNVKRIKEIEEYLGCNNRKARNIINILRTQYEMKIVSLSNDDTYKGYFLLDPANEKDRELGFHYLRENMSRIKHIAASSKAVKEALESKKDLQLELF